MTSARFPNAPPQIASRPVDKRGYPVPWFVSMIDGDWDFVRVDPRKILEAHTKHTCWVCGRRLGPRKAFVIGPMCTVNRVAAEPPTCLSCARFSVTACPFLSRPLAKRPPLREGSHAPPAGIMISRNPGVTAIWETPTYRAQKMDGGLLFFVGAPSRVTWWREGRPATYEEVGESFVGGLPSLSKIAEAEGPDAVSALRLATQRAVKLFPEKRTVDEGRCEHEH